MRRTFDREDVAKRFRARLEVDLATGSYVDLSRAREPLGVFAETWRRSIVDLRRSTLSRLDATLAHHVLPR